MERKRLKKSTARQTDYMHYEFTKHFTDSLAQYQPLTELRGYNGDVLIVHGTADTVIPVDYCFLYQKMFWLRKEGNCDKEVNLQGDQFSSKASRENCSTPHSGGST